MVKREAARGRKKKNAMVEILPHPLTWKLDESPPTRKVRKYEKMAGSRSPYIYLAYEISV